MTGISKSQVSRLCGEIDGKIAAFLDRPLEGEWPYIWLDATYVKARRDGRIVSVAVIIAVGVNDDGRREVLGLAIGASEAETFWTDFLRKLARRGLRGVKLVVSDAHEGLKAAIAKVLNATWQRCRVHFMRNVLAHAGKSPKSGASAPAIGSDPCRPLPKLAAGGQGDRGSGLIALPSQGAGVALSVAATQHRALDLLGSAFVGVSARSSVSAPAYSLRAASKGSGTGSRSFSNT